MKKGWTFSDETPGNENVRSYIDIRVTYPYWSFHRICFNTVHCHIYYSKLEGPSTANWISISMVRPVDNFQGPLNFTWSRLLVPVSAALVWTHNKKVLQKVRSDFGNDENLFCGGYHIHHTLLLFRRKPPPTSPCRLNLLKFIQTNLETNTGASNSKSAGKGF